MKHKSITVPDYAYNRIMKYTAKHTTLVDKMLKGVIKEQQEHQSLASKIIIIPEQVKRYT